MIEVMGVLMNVDLQAYNRNEGGPTSAGPPPSTSEGFPRPPTYSNTPSSSQVPPATPATPVTEPAKVEEDVEMSEEEDEEAAEERKRKLEVLSVVCCSIADGYAEEWGQYVQRLNWVRGIGPAHSGTLKEVNEGAADESDDTGSSSDDTGSSSEWQEASG